MPRTGPPPESLFDYDYVSRTRNLPVNLMVLVPWIVFYEFSLIGTRSPVENAAAAWIRSLVATMGHRFFVLTSLLSALVLLLVVLLRRREATRDPGIFAGMYIEAACYAALLGVVSSVLAKALPMGRLVPLSGTAGFYEPLQGVRVGLRDLGLAVGAGVFEELVFRGLGVVALLWILRHAFGLDRISGVLLAIIAAAYLFSDYHHWGRYGEPYTQGVFAFRFYAGVLLGAIFITRGLGIAALTHAFYDMVLILRT